MKWKKYLKWIVLAILALVILIPSYRYFGSIDWSKTHSNRIAALAILQETDDTGEFRLPIADMEFLIRTAGMQNDGPAVILLHGFPESSIMWNALLKKASSEGYRVLAFDQRGYSPGARPSDTDAYHIDHLTKDVLAVADKAGFDKFHLVGHDWGALIGWNLAMTKEERILSWTSLTIPHAGVFFDAILNDLEQQKRSSYIKQLQSPFLPEYKFVSEDQKFFKQLMQSLPEDHLKEYVALQAEYGAATATLNWYRALNLEEAVANKTYLKKVNSPTLFIWGTEDGVIAPSIIPKQKEWITGAYKEVAMQTGHSLIQQKEDSVLTEVLAHFKRNSILKLKHEDLVAVLDTIGQKEQTPIRLRDSLIQIYGAESKEAEVYQKEYRKNHLVNIIKIKDILDQGDWPEPSVIGEQGNLTICNVLQHADQDTRERYLPMMQQAVKDKKLEPRFLVRAEDRLATDKGQLQIYGGQMKYYPKTKSFNLWPVFDPENIDKRREKIGLEPIAVFLKNRFDFEWNLEEQMERTIAFEKERLKSK